MERNSADDVTSPGASSIGTSTPGASSFGAGATTTSDDASPSMSDRASDALDGAKDALGDAKDAASERLGQVKERATAFKATLADKLDAGASSLRERAQTPTGGAQLAGATAGTSSGAAGLLDSDQVQRLAGPAADAMEKTADFLRNGNMQEALEEQVRTNPGRTLLIALGVGYVLGKALRR